MDNDQKWTTEPGGPVDRALTTIARLKEAFDAELDFILVDTNKRSAAPDGTEMATIAFHVVVKAKHDEIEPQLREVGLVMR
jgi:hypothetical protein